jgi:hypothetical protein
MEAAPFIIKKTPDLTDEGQEESNNNSDNKNSIIKSTDFQFKYNNKTFTVTISLTSDKQFLYIDSKEEGNIAYIYTKKMSFLDLIKFNKVFKTCEDLEDSYNSMVVIFKNEKNVIKEIKDNKLILSIFILKIDSSYDENNLELTKQNQNKDLIIENLCQIVNELKINNTNLQNELNNVKEKLEKMEKKLIDIENNNFVNKLESKIIREKKELDFILERLKKVNLDENIIKSDKINIDLIYRATRDGDKAKDFHLKCDKCKNNLVIIRTKTGLKFGGFTRESWEGKGDKLDKEAFCFSLDKNKIYNYVKGKSSIFVSPESGPSFGNCVFEIKDDFLEMGGVCSEDYFYDNQEKVCEINDGNEQFDVEEIEVFKVLF